MARPGPGNAIRLRVELEGSADPLAALVGAIGDAGGSVTTLETVAVTSDGQVVDVAFDAAGAEHAAHVVAAVDSLSSASVMAQIDQTFAMHEGGKLAVVAKAPVRSDEELARAYTPGVARVCLAIAQDPLLARELTVKRNTVAVVTDGSAVLGLGNIGPLAALPVMEGKAMLFKEFADVDAWPICLDTQDTEELISIVKAIAPGFGGINLEDISAPRCFEVERRPKQELDIPVFHDDQHGTAIVVTAALENALKVVGKSLSHVRIVISGAGAAGCAIFGLLHNQGAGDIVVCDSRGVLNLARLDMPDLDESKQWIATNGNPRGVSGTLQAALAGADVFIGVSGPSIVDGPTIATMASRAIVFALSNPVPEVDPDVAAAHATVVATGRSDHPNQINNVLVFPGLFRGLLDAGTAAISVPLMLSAARAIAAAVEPDDLSPSHIVPSVFDPAVAQGVAEAVRRQAQYELSLAGSPSSSDGPSAKPPLHHAGEARAWADEHEKRDVHAGA